MSDPEFTLIDAQLTAQGEAEAAALQTRANALTPEVLVVSPMRRATQTALIAFRHHIGSKGLPVVACELAHEISGKVTWDKRLSVAALRQAFPEVDYSQITSEEDPYWGDGNVSLCP